MGEEGGSNGNCRTGEKATKYWREVEAIAQSDWRDYTQDKVRRRKNRDWKGNMENKTTMRYYQHKVKRTLNNVLEGDRDSTRWALVRAGELPMVAKIGKMRQLVKYCQLCRSPGAESIEHFMLECPINNINSDKLVNDLKELWGVGRFSEWMRKDQKERVADIVM